TSPSAICSTRTVSRPSASNASRLAAAASGMRRVNQTNTPSAAQAFPERLSVDWARSRGNHHRVNPIASAKSPTMIRTPAVQRWRSPRSLIHAWSTAPQLDREGAQGILPEEGIEHAWTARKQLSGVQRMAFLRHALAQLVDPEREHLRLLQFTVHFAELLRQLLALIGNVGIFRRRILGRRRTELLEALLHLAHAGLEFVDFCAKRIRRNGERLSETGERFSGGILAVDGRFDRVERGFDRLERRRFGGLCPRGCVDGGGANENGADHGPRSDLSAHSK